MREAYHQEDYTKKNTYTITTISQKITCKNVTYARMIELLDEGGNCSHFISLRKL